MGCYSDCSDSASFTTKDLDTLARYRVGECDAALVFWAKRRIKELETQTANLCGMHEHSVSARLAAEARVKELEAIIGRIQSTRGDETEVDALCDEALGKDGE